MKRGRVIPCLKKTQKIYESHIAKLLRTPFMHGISGDRFRIKFCVNAQHDKVASRVLYDMLKFSYNTEGLQFVGNLVIAQHAHS